MRVYGGSMLPAVWPGDVLSIHRAAPADLTPGELVLCRMEDHFVVHRLVSKSEASVITRGDALDWDDAPVLPCQALGRVVGIERCGFTIAPSIEMGRSRMFVRFLMRRCYPFKAAAMRLAALSLKIHRALHRKEAAA